MAVRIEGAAEHNLRDVDVGFGDGITAVVGVSGSGKSSLVFDTLYHEARRRFLETLSLGSPALRMRPARVRDIQGLAPAVAVAQNTVNRNPHSTVATATGIHPFLRVLDARFAERRCPRCGEVAATASLDTQLATLRELVATGPVEVVAPLVRGAQGSHARLLDHLRHHYPTDTIDVDGRPWAGASLDPDRPHEITVRVGFAEPGAGARELRRLLGAVVSLGTPYVTFRTGGTSRTLSRAPLCPGCGGRLPVARPQDFHGDVEGYRLAGSTLAELLRLDVDAALAAVEGAALPPPAGQARDQVTRRLRALAALGLGYLSLDRASPTLSRGEAQRVRLAVILAADVEDLLHVVDEPTIGLGPGEVGGLLRELGRLRGPVVLVEHDPAAVAAADHVVEFGPGAGPAGGRVVFEGPPAALWRADTESGRWFSARPQVRRATGAPSNGTVTVRGAKRHNLRGFDCDFPVGALTVVTGPSGAGKTTLVRGVLMATVEAGKMPLRPVLVDQSPIGRNPRSNPATYTGLASRVRAIYARTTGLPGSAFSFNRPDGACAECGGMGAVEVKLTFLPSEWLPCEACGGQRFTAEVRGARVPLGGGKAYSVAELYGATVDEAAGLLADDPAARRILAALRDVGLGYVRLGQPSPTLSGGEAQRVKLAKQLAAAHDAQLVVLDEPTTGLHPANLSQLLAVLRGLVDRGSTVVVVEHHPAVVAAADWLVRLGPGAGPDGGALLYAGPPAGDPSRQPPAPRPRRQPRAGRRASAEIQVRGASANNLRGVSVTIPKRALTAVVGVSGSGKSSLVRDVLAAEATRRLLECLSMYERQSIQEGPQAPVKAVTGLGPTVTIGPERRLWNPRGTVGTATELSFHLGVLLAYAGERGPGAAGLELAPSDFSPATYEAACLRCHGVGTVPVPREDRLIAHPDRPICAGALYSPGFFPHSYLSKPDNGGYWMLQALAQRYGFDPFSTPYRDLSPAAREAFLNGSEQVELAPEARRMASRTVTWRGVLSIMASWDVGGLYTDHVECPACGGARLRPRFLDVRLAGLDRQGLHRVPVAALERALAGVAVPRRAPGWTGRSLRVVRRRLAFLARVGLDYLHLDRASATLSAGEVQRVKLASLLGAELTGMTVLLDEPSRGLHPREVEALGAALAELRDAGNTAVFVDHDPRLVSGADHVVLLGPGAGTAGGTVVAAGPPGEAREAAGRLLDPVLPGRRPRAEPTGELVVRAPTEHNLAGEDVEIPLGVLTGVCGVSGSGKSTLVIDVLARALDPPKLTSSVAYEAIGPGAHAGIDGAPARTVHADQTRTGIRTPGAFLAVLPALRRAYADSGEAAARGLTAEDLVPRCDACRGNGAVREEMSFLPAVERPCDVCEATGYRAEARELMVRGLSLPKLEASTLDEVVERWGDHEPVARPLRAAARLGLGYLTLGQRSRTLSGGERQRLKLAKELGRQVSGRAGPPGGVTAATLFILDEPTVGLHPLDIAQLAGVLGELVADGHSVLVVDHDPLLLACCDRLIELGPGGGPHGGRVIAAGTPEQLAAGDTPTAPYLKAVLA